MDFGAQAEEIRGLLKRSHLSEDEMARRAHLKPETLRKYLGGYQKAGTGRMVALRAVAQMEIDRLSSAAGKSGPPGELHDDVVAYAGKLLEMAPENRELAKQLIDKLHANCEHSRASIRRKAALSGTQAVERYRQQKQVAGGSIDRKAAPDSGAHRGTNPLQPGPKGDQPKNS